MKSDFCANPSDWDDLATYFKDEGNMLFPYCLPDGGALIILINRDFFKVGTMPFGGNPLGRVYVSIKGRGSDDFAANFNEDIWADSLLARLGLTKHEAKAVKQLFAALRERLN